MHACHLGIFREGGWAAGRGKALERGSQRCEGEVSGLLLLPGTPPRDYTGVSSGVRRAEKRKHGQGVLGGPGLLLGSSPLKRGDGPGQSTGPAYGVGEVWREGLAWLGRSCKASQRQ